MARGICIYHCKLCTVKRRKATRGGAASRQGAIDKATLLESMYHLGVRESLTSIDNRFVRILITIPLGQETNVQFLTDGLRQVWKLRVVFCKRVEKDLK